MRIEDEIIGQKTKNGILITGQSRHFMQRVIGTARDPEKKTLKGKYVHRSGVEIDDIKDAIFNGKVAPAKIKNGDVSQEFFGERCEVTVNPITGNLIQCNKLERRKKK